jgi:hypothetical protein
MSPAVSEADGGAPIRQTLLRCRAERFSGRVHISGGPGGVLYLTDGLVTAATTAAAPGPESLLLKSGRMAESDWLQAYDAGAVTGGIPAELVGRGLISEFGLQVLCLSAAFDAAFAMAVFGADACRAEPAVPDAAPHPLPLRPGLEPERLLTETTRRLRLAGTWRHQGVTVRCRPRRTPAADAPPPDTDERHREILRLVNGRRTPRDIAFAAGRNLFVVLGQIMELVRRGLLDTDTGDSADTQPIAVTVAGGPGSVDPLPQRRRGASKVNEVLPPRPATRRPLLRRLRPGRPQPPFPNGPDRPAGEGE